MKRDNSRIACKLYKIGYNDTVQKLFLSLSHSTSIRLATPKAKAKSAVGGTTRRSRLKYHPRHQSFKSVGKKTIKIKPWEIPKIQKRRENNK